MNLLFHPLIPPIRPHSSLNVHLVPIIFESRHFQTETWQADCNKYLLMSLFSLPFSVLVIALFLYLSPPTPDTVLFVSIPMFVLLFWLFSVVCCRHCSPVHYFFSVFTAHHWASLSVCLPNLHPKFQLFIYNQLVRYCTVLSFFFPQHLHLASSNGTCLRSFTGTGTL